MSDAVISRNNIEVFGRGTPPMLFAHGFGCDQNMWRFITPRISVMYQSDRGPCDWASLLHKLHLIKK